MQFLKLKDNNIFNQTIKEGRTKYFPELHSIENMIGAIEKAITENCEEINRDTFLKKFDEIKEIANIQHNYNLKETAETNIILEPEPSFLRRTINFFRGNSNNTSTENNNEFRKMLLK